MTVVSVSFQIRVGVTAVIVPPNKRRKLAHGDESHAGACWGIRRGTSPRAPNHSGGVESLFKLFGVWTAFPFYFAKIEVIRLDTAGRDHSLFPQSFFQAL